MTHDKLHAVATEVLTEYFGVAAQFFIEDVVSQLPHSLSSTSHEELYTTYFLVTLSKVLPEDVPINKIQAEILDALSKK